MTLAPTRFNQPVPGPLLVNISGGVSPDNYDQQLFTLGSFINDILRSEVGNYSNNVSLPQTSSNVVPTDLYQSVMNAYGTALNSCITRRTLSTTPWSTVTTLSASNWTSFYNLLASLAMAVSNAITTAGL